MEEKNLLKEITFLSRLIGQHKNKLKNPNIAPSYGTQKASNRIHGGPKNLGVIPSKLPVQNLRTTVSRYSKINRTFLQNPLKQTPVPAVASVLKEPIVQGKKSTALLHQINADNSASKVDETKQIKPNEDSSFVSDGKKSSSISSSVHINPNFFTSAKGTQQEIATLRCKSVHINPRLLGAVRDEACNFVPSNKVVSSEVSATISQTKAIPCGDSSKSANSHESQTQPLSASSQISAVKCTDSSDPLQTSVNRKKYIYQSKTKLVKACVSTPAGECKLNRKNITPVNLQGAAKTIKTPHGGTLLAVSRTKLVRLPGKTRRLSSSKSASFNASTPVTKSRYSLQRASTSIQSPIVRTARRVSSKYRSATVVMMLGASSKYCLDHRLNKTLRKGKQSSGRCQFKVDHRSPSSSTPTARGIRVHSHLLISPIRRSSFSNRTWTAATPRIGRKVAISQKKLSRIGCDPGSRNRHNSALIRIGGLLYKSSRTKLILSKSPEKKIDTSARSRTVVKRRSLNAGHVVYVRGNKFVMDQSGKTLKRVTENLCQSPSSRDRKRNWVSRVDIGGVTYIQKSPSVLVRTNTHTARNVVSNAKQRSIAFLAQKMRKINTPCLFYRRFGRCPRQEKGRCELVHDPKYIDICKKFLQGKCTLDGCLLSHDVGPEKMPTCRFFLEGCCVREFCPYLHVKVNDDAPICRSFLQGYCADGPECLKRHFMVCPEFDKKGSCGKGKYCPYPHSIAPRVPRAVCLDPPIASSEECKMDQTDNPAPQKRKRYYETDDSDEQDENQTESCMPLKMKRYYETETDAEAVLEEVTQDSQSNADMSGDDLTQSITESPYKAPLRKRPKIGDLPSFIALESFEFE